MLGSQTSYLHAGHSDRRSTECGNFTRVLQEERENSEEQSSLVNQAYSVLRSPLKRAFYLVRSLLKRNALRLG